MTAHPTVEEIAAIQRHSTRVLMGAVGLAGMGMAGGFAAIALAAEEMTGSDGWATFAATMNSVGSAIVAIPLARFMDRHGRRVGLRWGWILAALGALLSFFSVLTQLFPLLIVGSALIGFGNGTNLAARYAAADLAESDRRARAIGFLVWFSAIGAVLGPTLALGPSGWLAEQLGFDGLAGPYLLGLAVFGGAALIVDRGLRPDPLLLARELGGVTDARRPGLGESFAKLAGHRLASIAVLAMAVGQGIMVAVMTVTPLHLNDGNHAAKIIGFVISLHIVGMFFFAPVVGWLVDRLPAAMMVAAAGVILFAGAELAANTDPEDSLGVFIGLLLVGLGWSFAMISGSAMLTAVFAVNDRASVQGAADFTMIAAGAIGGLLSGVVVGTWSYYTLGHYAAILALALVAAALIPSTQPDERETSHADADSQ